MSERSTEKNLHPALVLSIKVLLFCAFLIAAELIYRVTIGVGDVITQTFTAGIHATEGDKKNENRFFWTIYKPFVMFATTPLEGWGVHNIYTGQTVPARLPTNSDGFLVDHDFDFAKSYAKQLGERVVLFTGASSAWGVGATSMDKTITARMEYYLNQHQQRYKYRVINMAMGGWIAFQEFIGLAYWGRSYDPDWIVTMDGVNDGTLVCGEARGAGKPKHNDTYKAFVTSYLFGQYNPSFFRGRFENWLLQHSRLYRRLTKKAPIRVPEDVAYIEGTTPVGRNSAIRDVPWLEVERQVRFYIDTQRQIANLFPKAKVFLSTQPLVNDFRGHYLDMYDIPEGPKRQEAIARFERLLDLTRQEKKDERCGTELTGKNFGYFMARIAIGTERLARTMSQEQRRTVLYDNMGRFFENDLEARKPYFVDPAHLSEKGMDILGRMYAERILAQDR